VLLFVALIISLLLLFRIQCKVVLDLMDSVEDKCSVVLACRRKGIPVVEAGAAGGKRDPTKVRVDCISFDGQISCRRRRRRRFFSSFFSFFGSSFFSPVLLRLQFLLLVTLIFVISVVTLRVTPATDTKVAI